MNTIRRSSNHGYFFTTVVVVAVAASILAADAQQCSSDLRQSIDLSEHLYRDMTVYEREGNADLEKAQESNLVHQLDLAQDESDACRDRPLILRYLRLKMLLLSRGRTNALLADILVQVKSTASPSPTNASGYTDTYYGPNFNAWYQSLLVAYKQAVAFGFPTAYPKDDATVKAVIASNSPAERAARFAAMTDDTPHLQAETKVALDDLETAMLKLHPNEPRRILSVRVRYGEVYEFVVDDAFWKGTSESDHVALLSSLQTFANNSHARANPSAAPDGTDVTITVRNPAGVELAHVRDGQALPF